jgi:putative acyl-CoA dehydrogenase
MVRYAPAEAADAFAASRLSGDWGRTFGTLPSGAAAQKIIARASLTA